MKLRSDFVSNSSTTSYVMVGWYLDDIKEKLEKAGIIEDDGDEWEVIDDVCEKLGLDWHAAYGEEELLIGRDLISIDNCDYEIGHHVVDTNGAAKELKDTMEREGAKNLPEPNVIAGTYSS